MSKTTSTTKRLRTICLALPEASERAMFDHPAFRVRDKIFAMVVDDDGRPTVWCKAPPGSQAVLVGADPERFFAPPYVGPKGWIGIRLDDAPDWAEVAALVRRSFRLVAPEAACRADGLSGGPRIAIGEGVEPPHFTSRYTSATRSSCGRGAPGAGRVPAKAALCALTRSKPMISMYSS